MNGYDILFERKLDKKVCLSAALITRNSEKRIENCLNSFKDIVDEIVIVDDFSNDNTIKKIKEYSDKISFIISNKLDSFAEQRNISLKFCKGQYILIIDDDEVLSKELRHSIYQLKKIKNNISEVFYCQGINYNFHGYSVELKSKYKRPIIVKNGLFFEGSVHENVNGSVSFLDGDLLHYSDASIRSFLDDILKYSKIKAKKWIKEGRNYGIFFLTIRQIFVAFFLLMRRLFFEKRVKDGPKALIYCIAWMAEELFVGLWFIELTRNNKQ
jgi:glycosyltransferase involved in cell wall biosynthesis